MLRVNYSKILVHQADHSVQMATPECGFDSDYFNLLKPQALRNLLHTFRIRTN